MLIYIVLDGPPVPKGRPKFANISGRPIAYTPKKTRDYEERLSEEARRVMGKRPLLTKALELYVYAFLPIPASWSKAKREMALCGDLWPCVRPDWDNIGKITDALNCVVWADDKQIIKATVSKLYAEEPALHVMVREINGGDSSEDLRKRLQSRVQGGY